MAAPKAVASGKVVKYVGTADVRRISAADWRKADVEDQNQVEWSKDNKFTVPVADLSDNAMQIIEKDSGFVITDADV